jgi:hypothetical protein
MAWVASFIYLLLWMPPDEWGNAVRELFDPATWDRALGDDDWWGFIGVPLILLVATQTVFILPYFSRGLRRVEHGVSLRTSVAMAAIVAAALTIGLGFAVWNLVHLIQFNLGVTSHLDFDVHVDRDIRWWLLIGALIVSWTFWSVLLLLFAGRKTDRWVGTRLIGLLLGGTILEVIVVIPLDIMVRRKTDCYCSTGTFFSLCLSAWALLWLAGPGAIIAVLSKRRRLWWETHCASCGYEKGPSPGTRCPECGFEWSDKGARPT